MDALAESDSRDAPGDENASAENDPDEDGSSGRYERARRVGERYGLVGLALAGPPLAGLHLMVVVGPAIGPDDRAAIGWLTAGLAVRTVLLVAGSVAGLSALESLFVG